MREDRHRPVPPTPDAIWERIDAVMRRHAYSSHALIETLHVAQEAFGYLDKATLAWVAGSLRVPLSRAYGVATFYHLFRTEPPGRQLCVVCMGTACWLKGAGEVMRGIAQTLGVHDGETTSDGQVSLLSAHCVGQCGMAPLVVLDGEVVGPTSAPTVVARIAARRAGPSPAEEAG